MNKLLLNPFLHFVGSLEARLDTAPQSYSAASPGTQEGLVVDSIEMIHRVAAELGRERHLLASGTVEELRYAMAAWSDELLLSHWQKSSERAEVNGSVEERLFKTMEAGERIFWCIDRSLSRRSEGDLQMAPVYLTLLAMGYRGQYSGAEMPRRLRVQQDDLCAVCGIDKVVDAPPSKPLPPEPIKTSQRPLHLTSISWGAAGAISLSCLLYADWHWQRSFAFIDEHLVNTSSEQAELPAHTP